VTRRALLLILGLAGCRDATAPRTVSGNWTGTTIVASMNFVMSAELEDAGGTVSGAGHIISAGIDCEPAITGTRTGSSVSLTFTCPSYTPFEYTAELAKDGRTLTGALRGSGFTNTTLVLGKLN
jgi:hypothetical protein